MVFLVNMLVFNAHAYCEIYSLSKKINGKYSDSPQIQCECINDMFSLCSIKNKIVQSKYTLLFFLVNILVLCYRIILNAHVYCEV